MRFGWPLGGVGLAQRGAGYVGAVEAGAEVLG